MVLILHHFSQLCIFLFSSDLFSCVSHHFSFFTIQLSETYILFKPNDILNQDGALVNEAKKEFGDWERHDCCTYRCCFMVAALYLVGQLAL